MTDAAIERDLSNCVVLEGLDSRGSGLQVVVVHEAIPRLSPLFLEDRESVRFDFNNFHQGTYQDARMTFHRHVGDSTELTEDFSQHFLRDQEVQLRKKREGKDCEWK